jgi:carbon-monoxide dehydrogenase small subunit
LRINGTVHAVDVEPWAPLVDVLRDRLRLTGTKEGCSIGVCGVCSVLVDGELLSGCLMPVGAAADRDITTIEGLADGDDLTPMQDAFIEHGGFQCGICTPGQIVASTALLADEPSPTEAEIRHWLGGNLCRCTGYQQIVEAVGAAAAKVPATDRQ